MAIAIRGLTGEDEAAFIAAAAAGAPVFALLADLFGRTVTREGAPLADAEGLTAGEAQALALRLRAASAEGPIRTTFACAACGERVDLSLAPKELLAAPACVPATISADGFMLTCRPPTVAEILAAGESGEPETAARVLLAQCVSARDPQDVPVACDALPEHVADAAAAHLLAMDPQAETVLACTCPGCGAALKAVLDPAQFLAAELSGQEASLFVEVLAIAARTGWTEQAILAMPRHRRRGYAAALGAA